MSGIRVLNLPKEVSEKSLKIHFSKPENGGGRIRKIYFPLFHNDAVILFESKRGKIYLLSVHTNNGINALLVSRS